MAARMRNTISALLEAIRADHPRRQKAAEELMDRMGLEADFNLVIQPPRHAVKIPTFDRTVWRPPTPMLRARFDFAGSLQRGQEIWLDAEQMATYMKKRRVRDLHLAMRENYDGSAPMLFPDSQLTLFGATEDVPEDLTYLVWKKDTNEPEVWCYEGYDFQRSTNLEEFLNWRLNRN